MGRILYTLAVAMASCLLSFAVVVLLGPRFENGEEWAGLLLGWMLFGIPGAVLLSMISAVTIQRSYLRRGSLWWRAAVFAANSVAVAGCVLAFAYLHR